MLSSLNQIREIQSKFQKILGKNMQELAGGSERKVMLSARSINKWDMVKDKLERVGKYTLNCGIYSKSNRESPRVFNQKDDTKRFVPWKEYYQV